MVEKELDEMATQYFKLETEILDRVTKLPSYNEDCDCGEPHRFCVAEDDLVICFCLNCGGNIYY